MSRKNVIFDSQILNTLQNCAYKTDLIFNKNFTTEHKAQPLEEGDLLHKMFEFYNLGIKEHGTDIIYDNEKFEKHVQVAIEFGEKAALEMELSTSDASEVIFQFEKYVNFTRMDGVKILEVERAFMIELYKDDDIGVYYTGKIDRLTDTPQYGIIPRDYKKAKRTEEPTSTSNQFTGYALATWPDGALNHTVMVDKVGFQKTLTPEDRFRSYPLTYSKMMIDEWKRDTIWWGRMYAYHIENDLWPRNRTACDKYAGCFFRPHCEALDKEQQVHVLKTHFVIGEPWDVTKHLKPKDALTVEEITPALIETAPVSDVPSTASVEVSALCKMGFHKGKFESMACSGRGCKCECHG